jgi:hypothetical protein
MDSKTEKKRKEKKREHCTSFGAPGFFGHFCKLVNYFILIILPTPFLEKKH